MLSPSPQAPPPAFRCAVCDQSFGRQEHLTRHKRIHTQERPYRCSSCDKRFSRLDVLNRHMASHGVHEDNPVVVASSRACEQCAVDRVRCSRGSPCRRCSQRQLSCSYPRSRRGRSNTQSNSVPTRTTADPVQFDAALDAAPLHALQGGAMNASLPRSGMSGLEYDSLAWTAGPENIQLMNNPSQLGLGVSGINWMSPQFDDSIDLNALFAELADGNSTHNFPEVAYDEEAMDFGGLVAPSLQPLAETDKEVDDPVYYVSGNGARAPFKGRSHRRGSILSSAPSHETRSDEGVPLPFPQAENASLLCPLETYQSLVCAIQSEKRLQEQRVEDVDVPSHHQVQIYVERYFEAFHPVFPFLRKSSFVADVSKDWVLLLAVSLVGSKLTRRLNIHGQEDDMFQILRSSLQRHRAECISKLDNANRDSLYVPGRAMRTEDPRELRMLQASVLNAICMLHSGQQTLVEQSLIERHYIVETCRSLQLLRGDVDNNELVAAETPSEEATKMWLLRETKIRTGMIIWLLDSIFLYTLGERPLMQLEDVQTVLPSHEDVWEDAELIRSGQRSPSKVTMSASLERLYMEKDLPPDLGEFSAALLINAIYRHTGNIIEREQSRLNLWTPTALVQQRPEISAVQSAWLPNTPTALKWRNSACDCMDVIHWLANSRLARSAGFEHHTILHLHLARIIVLTPTSFIQSFAAKTSIARDASFSSKDKQALVTAQKQLLQWVILDQCKARLSVIHCSALYWHVRRYSCDSPLEPYAIYIATLALWAYCFCLNLPEVIAARTEVSDSELEPTFLHLDRPLDDELVQVFVREGHKIAAYISKVGDIRDRSAPVKILKEGIMLLTGASKGSCNNIGQSEGMPYTWGIERSYVQSLRQLLLADAVAR